MARKKTKEYRPLTIRMDAAVYERLSDYSEESGQPKTVAVERALTMFIDEYDRKKALIEKAKIAGRENYFGNGNQPYN